MTIRAKEAAVAAEAAMVAAAGVEVEALPRVKGFYPIQRFPDRVAAVAFAINSNLTQS
jgi:hypothetical protein